VIHKIHAKILFSLIYVYLSYTTELYSTPPNNCNVLPVDVRLLLPMHYVLVSVATFFMLKFDNNDEEVGGIVGVELVELVDIIF